MSIAITFLIWLGGFLLAVPAAVLLNWPVLLLWYVWWLWRHLRWWYWLGTMVIIGWQLSVLLVLPLGYGWQWLWLVWSHLTWQEWIVQLLLMAIWLIGMRWKRKQHVAVIQLE